MAKGSFSAPSEWQTSQNQNIQSRADDMDQHSFSPVWLGGCMQTVKKLSYAKPFVYPLLSKKDDNHTCTIVICIFIEQVNKWIHVSYYLPLPF